MTRPKRQINWGIVAAGVVFVTVETILVLIIIALVRYLAGVR